MTFSNQLTPAEAERLALLLEEMGEVQQIIGKILRHGYESFHPDSPQITNRELLEKEMGDLTFAVRLMIFEKDVSRNNIDVHAEVKRQKIGKWLHHNEKLVNFK
jgi:NTP pyrophosphatase (non-canonical NTP hydrolase)